MLNEFANESRSKLNWPWADIEAAVGLMKGRMRKVVLVTVETNAEAIELARDQGLALYDALIIASAIGAGCDTLWSRHRRADDPQSESVP